MYAAPNAELDLVPSLLTVEGVHPASLAKSVESSNGNLNRTSNLLWDILYPLLNGDSVPFIAMHAENYFGCV